MKRVLHVAAMPFPTEQGTQAAIGHMLRAQREYGAHVELLSHAHGSGAPVPAARHHRLGDWPRVRSLRSGPSLGKLALDARLVARLRVQGGYDVLVAHHVEAASAALLSGAGPLIFVAHTDLQAELPSYFARALQRPAGAGGAWLDRRLASGADALVAISPWLARRFAERGGRRVRYAPIPWPASPRAGEGQRHRARQAMGLDLHTELALYQGNLDAYQGAHDLIEVLVARPSLHLLLATASDAAAFAARARRAGVAGRLHVQGLDGEQGRRLAAAAADVAVVPRKAPGGVPVKMLDALGRGLATVAVRRATQQLPLEGAALIAPDDDPPGLARAIGEVLEQRGLRACLEQRSQKYLQAHHDPRHFVRALDAATDQACRHVQLRAAR